MNKIYIAHRGLHSNTIPENSIASFKEAIKHNYGIEFDVRMTKDGVFIIFHDKTTKRLTNKDLIISNTSYEKIKKLKLANQESIPCLEELLNIVTSKTYLDIEIKEIKHYRKNLRKLKNILDSYNINYSIKSFDPRIARYYKKIKPKIKCGVLSYNYHNCHLPRGLKYILRNCSYLPFYKPDFIAYKIDDYNDKIARKVKKYAIPLMLWTIDDEDKFTKASKLTNLLVFEKIIPINEKIH